MHTHIKQMGVFLNATCVRSPVSKPENLPTWGYVCPAFINGAVPLGACRDARTGGAPAGVVHSATRGCKNAAAIPSMRRCAGGGDSARLPYPPGELIVLNTYMCAPPLRTPMRLKHFVAAGGAGPCNP